MLLIKNPPRVILEFKYNLRSYILINPDKELIEQAQKGGRPIQRNLLYARVDGIIINNQLHLMEVECIEPDLYLNLSDGALERFSNSIIEQTQK
jgi:hypothetical protein